MKVIPTLVGHTQKYPKKKKERKKIMPSNTKPLFFDVRTEQNQHATSNMNFYGNLGLQKISDFTSCF